MKTIFISILFFALTTFSITGQNILNPSFDSVYLGGIDRVFQWVTSDGFILNTGSVGDTIPALQPNTFYDASGFMFSEVAWFGNRIDTSPISLAAIQLTSRPHLRKVDRSPYEAFVINGNHFYTDSTGYPDLSKCGIPFTQRPSKLRGHYLFVDSTSTGNNFGKCIILLKKWNAVTQQSDTIAFTEDVTTLNTGSAIQAFEIPFSYNSTATPDTLMVAFFAASNPEAAASLWLDELSLVYSGIGVEEMNTEYIHVYPNPAANYLFIKANTNIEQLSLFNSLGQNVHTQKTKKPISVNHLEAGIYLMVIESKSGNYQQKVIIQHP